MRRLAVIGWCVVAAASYSVARAAEKGNTLPYFHCNRHQAGELASLICSSDELMSLDREMAEALANARNQSQDDPAEEHALQVRQEHWRKNLNERCVTLQKEKADVRRSELDCLRTAYRERLVVLNRPDISLPLTDEKVYEMAAYLGDKTCADISRIGEVESPQALREFSCRYFTIDPKQAARIFGSCRNMEQFAPVCDQSRKADTIVGLSQYISQLEYMRGGSTCAENVNSSHYRSAKIDELLLLNDGDVDPVMLKQVDMFDENQPSNPIATQIQRWSQQGLWEKAQYQTLKRLRVPAEEGLVAYYIQKFKWNPAKARKVAQYYMVYLANDYLGGGGNASGVVRVADLNDLDIYLKGDDAARARYKNQLGRFLRLAVVNDYPLDNIRKLLDDGAPVDGGGRGKVDTPLMQAALRPDVIRLLLERGANINAQNHFGKTALMYAIEYGNKKAITALMTHKPDVSLSTFDTEECESSSIALEAGGRTALMYAAWYSTPDIIRELIAYGADPSTKDSEGETSFNYLDKNATLSSSERNTAEMLLSK
ncbi:MAG TPA: ankyrin repeat domain-containing protein [Rickettsiales bacterium]|nr:ankyrin repeat domain-containing protein [Rickettsiales bacterium]